MNNILYEVIDYSLFDNLDIKQLKNEIVIPLHKKELYILVAASQDKIDLSWLQQYFKLPVKIKLFKKEEILFILQNIDEKINLHSLVQNLFYQDQYNKIDVNKFFHDLISLAIRKNSSDIHIETILDGLIIRFRIDGQLVQILKFGFGLYPIVSSIIKVISNLDISMKRLPQNGRFSQTINDKSFDFRVSIMPTISGESIVIRILNSDKVLSNIKNLGLDEPDYKQIINNLDQNQGLILVTGPTGSGKTTTMYAMLKELNDGNKKIITIEEPVEYQLSGISQININQSIGLTYAKTLKDILRQDPDVIMIGEIRDSQTLQIALQASLTGHLVVATLHTNDAISTIDRLLDLEALPFLIASTLNMVISQRLVRKLCPYCKQKTSSGDFLHIGCQKCNLTGYDSRIMLSEMLIIDKNIQLNIKNGYDKDTIYQYAKKYGFRTIYDNGLEKIKDGLTTHKELNLVCKPYEEI